MLKLAATADALQGILCACRDSLAYFRVRATDKCDDGEHHKAPILRAPCGKESMDARKSLRT
jgi:hypothetical protein